MDKRNEQEEPVATTTNLDDRPGMTLKDIENACLDIVRAYPRPALQALLVHPVDWPTIDQLTKRVTESGTVWGGLPGGLPVYIWKDGDEELLKMFGGQEPEPGKVVAKYHTAHLRIAADIIRRRLEELCDGREPEDSR